MPYKRRLLARIADCHYIHFSLKASLFDPIPLLGNVFVRSRTMFSNQGDTLNFPDYFHSHVHPNGRA